MRDLITTKEPYPPFLTSWSDAENIEYLRGFIDGYGGEEPHDVMPDGFNDINEVWDKMDELKGNKA